MRYLTAAMLAGWMGLFTGPAATSDNQMTIAVFTKNRTNPAYEAFRIASDQIARATGVKVIHLVPNQPDNVDEQKAMVEQVLKDRPDAIIFIPFDDVAMIDSVKKLNDANIPIVLVSNPLPGNFVTYAGADDFEIGYREARYLFEKLGAKGKIVVIEGTPAAPTNRERLARLPARLRRVSRHPGARLRHRQLPAGRRPARDGKAARRAQRDRRRAVGQ